MGKIKSQNVDYGNKINPSIPVDKNTNTLSPLFCLKFLSPKDGLSNCNKDEKASLINKIHSLCQLKWNQIISSHRHGLGSETITVKAVNITLPSNFENIEKYTVLRFDGKKAMIGHRDGRIYHIFALDPKFKLYKHN